MSQIEQKPPRNWSEADLSFFLLQPPNPLAKLVAIMLSMAPECES
jgi:hypothetical protein